MGRSIWMLCSPLDKTCTKDTLSCSRQTPVDHTMRDVKKGLDQPERNVYPNNTTGPPSKDSQEYPHLEDHTENFKLPVICASNHSTPKHEALEQLKQAHNTITIKPTDKNLSGILMDYLTQCMSHLTIQTPTDQYQNTPPQIHQQISYGSANTATHTTSKGQPQTLCFYGIPKLHKTFHNLSHTSNNQRFAPHPGHLSSERHKVPYLGLYVLLLLYVNQLSKS